MPLPDNVISVNGLAVAAGVLLPALGYLMIKHLFADFYFQTRKQMREKGTYGALGGFTHAATHAALSAPVFCLLPAVSFGIAAVILIGEFVLHYHIDWAKEQVVRRHGLQPGDNSFWFALGTDQLLHGLTYVAMVWLIVLRT